MKTARTNRIGRSAFLMVAASLVMAACTVEVGGGSDPGEPIQTLRTGERYTADVTPYERTIRSGATATVRIDLESADAEGIFVVANAGDLRVRNPVTGAIVASSSTGFYFARGERGIEATDALAGLAPQSIDPAVRTSCLGPCVILRDSDRSDIIRSRSAEILLENPFDDRLDVELYVFSQALDDRSEPRNDTRSGADVLSETLWGALETIGDVDTFELASDGDVTVHAPIRLDGGPASLYLSIEVEVLDSDGARIPAAQVGGQNPVVLGPDESHTFTDLFEGEFVRVREATGNRAAAAEYSGYRVVLDDTVSVPLSVRAR